jgi:hypothetical protein
MVNFGRSLTPPRQIVAAACLLAALSGTSGAAAPAPDSAEPGVKVHFTVFSAVPITGLGFRAKPDAPPTPVAFYPTARSPRYEYVGANPLRFQSIPTAADGATAEFKALAEVTFAPTMREAFLLFEPMLPAAREGVRYRVYVLDDSTVRQGPGTLTFVNLSGLPLSGSAGRSFVNLRDALVATFTVGHSAPVALKVPYGGRNYQAYGETIDLEPGERALLILFPPFRAGSLEVQSRLLIDKPAEAESGKR